jgi:6-phosphogluconolactonase
MRLMVDPRYRYAPWKQTHIWVVDERRVPPTDERSNYRMIRETLLDHIPTRSRLLHPMPVLDDNAPAAYEQELRSHLPDGRLDMVMLGMGDDAHTASLFPQSPAVEVSDRWVAANHGPRVKPPERLTMTYPLLNAARFLAVLVTGAAKAGAVRRVDEHLRRQGPAPRELPVTGIQPDSGRLCWYLDAAAAGSDGTPEQIELA